MPLPQQERIASAHRQAQVEETVAKLRERGHPQAEEFQKLPDWEQDKILAQPLSDRSTGLTSLLASYWGTKPTSQPKTPAQRAASAMGTVRREEPGTRAVLPTQTQEQRAASELFLEEDPRRLGGTK